MQECDVQGIFDAAFDDFVSDFKTECNLIDQNEIIFDSDLSNSELSNNSDDNEDKVNIKRKGDKSQSSNFRKNAKVDVTDKIWAEAFVSNEQNYADSQGEEDIWTCVQKTALLDTQENEISSLDKDHAYIKHEAMLKQEDEVIAKKHLRLRINLVLRAFALCGLSIPLWNQKSNSLEQNSSIITIDYPMSLRFGKVFDIKNSFVLIFFQKQILDQIKPGDVVDDTSLHNRAHKLYMELARKKHHAKILMTDLNLFVDGKIDRYKVFEFIKKYIIKIEVPNCLNISPDDESETRNILKTFFSNASSDNVNSLIEQKKQFDLIGSIQSYINDTNSLKVVDSLILKQSNNITFVSQETESFPEDFSSNTNILEVSSKVPSKVTSFHMSRQRLNVCNFIDDMVEVSGEEEVEEETESASNNQINDWIDSSEFANQVQQEDQIRKLYVREKLDDQDKLINELYEKFVEKNEVLDNLDKQNVNQNEYLSFNMDDLNLKSYSNENDYLSNDIIHVNMSSSKDSFLYSFDPIKTGSFVHKDVPEDKGTSVARIKKYESLKALKNLFHK